MVTEPSPTSTARRVWRGLLVLLGALGWTSLCFLVLPLIQAITKTPPANLLLREADTVSLPPPPPPEPELEEPEPEQPAPPELIEQAPLDLSQLELALNAGLGRDGWMSGDFGVKLDLRAGDGSAGEDTLFSLADLDQPPRPIYQPSPAVTANVRKRAPATVHVLFVVDRQGRVEAPVVQKSTDPAFDAAAVTAVQRWKFEPGRRKGEPVRFRMRVPITFPKG